jgi:hypothetical protein
MHNIGKMKYYLHFKGKAMSRQNNNLLVAAFILLVSTNSLAATAAGPLPITTIRTGWNADSFAIMTNQPILNPANCTYPDAYMTGYTEPGYKTYLSVTLTAFAMNKPVTVIVSDTECTGGRPKIWGVYISK